MDSRMDIESSQASVGIGDVEISEKKIAQKIRALDCHHVYGVSEQAEIRMIFLQRHIRLKTAKRFFHAVILSYLQCQRTMIRCIIGIENDLNG